MRHLFRATIFLMGLNLSVLTIWHLALPKGIPPVQGILYEVRDVNLSNPKVYRIDMNGSGNSLLSEDIGTVPRSSNDGRWVIFLGNITNDAGYRLFQRSYAGESTAKLLYDSEQQPLSIYSYPIISSNNEWVVYSASDEGRSRLYRYSFATHERLPLTDLADDEYPIQVTNDGKWILVTSLYGDMYRVQSDGTVLENLTERFKIYSDAVISPNGEWIVYTRLSLDGNIGIYRSHFDGSARQYITQTVYDDFLPMLTISPDGDWLYFMGAKGTPNQFYRVRLDGSTLQNLTPRSLSNVNRYKLSPDGQWIVLSATSSNGRTDLFRLRANGSDFKQLTDTADRHESVFDFIPTPSLTASHTILLGAGGVLMIIPLSLRKWRRGV